MFSLWSKNHSTPSIVSAMKMFTAFSEWSDFPTGVIELFLKPRRAFCQSDNGIWGKILDDFANTCGWEIHTPMRSLIGQQDSFFRPPEVIKPMLVWLQSVCDKKSHCWNDRVITFSRQEIQRYDFFFWDNSAWTNFICVIFSTCSAVI